MRPKKVELDPDLQVLSEKTVTEQENSKFFAIL